MIHTPDDLRLCAGQLFHQRLIFLQRAEIFSGFEEIIPPGLRPVGFAVSRIRLQDFLHLQRLLLRTVSGIRKQTCRKRRHTVLFFQAVI